jgi:hypothetical protein
LRRLVPLALVCTLLGTGVANSTTVIAPTFTELVSKANLIFVGQVASVRAIWEPTPQGRAIITIVTFRVEDVWKGSVGAMTQLEFLGGTLDGMTLDVVGMPNFTAGQRDVLFVGDTVKTMSPLVGFMHGRFRVERDLASGVDRVRTHDGRSLPDVGEIGANRPPSFLSMTPMRLAAFEAAVAGQISAARVR